MHLQNLKEMNTETYPNYKLVHTFKFSILLHFLSFLMFGLVPQNVQDVGSWADADPRRWMWRRCNWRETTVASSRRSGGWRKDRGGGRRRRGCAQRSLRNQVGPGRKSRRGIGIRPIPCSDRNGMLSFRGAVLLVFENRIVRSR